MRTKGSGTYMYLKYPRMYRIWGGLKSRIQCKTNPDYPHYGGRGLLLQENWNKFENFLRDMKEGYSDNLSIDRVDNDKGYFKENCRWATSKQQNSNHSKNIKYNGETAIDASFRLGGTENLVRNRIKKNWTIEKAFTTRNLHNGVSN